METSWKFIVKETETGYYCIICGCDVFGTHNVKQHFHGNRHADSMDKYGSDISNKGNNKYYCNLCDCTILGYANVSDHVTGQRHTDFLEESEDESDTSEESVQYGPMDTEDFLLFDSDTHEYTCYLCDEEFKGHSKASKHLKEKIHRNTFKIYGSKISKCEPDSYFCELCECYMNSLKNVSDHINGLRHENNM